MDLRQLRYFIGIVEAKSFSRAAISLRVDPEVLEWFRTQGPGYQTRINGILRAYMEASRQP